MTEARTPSVSVVIVNYNTGDILKDCIASLFRFESCAELELIIVDNHSSDNSAAVINEISSKHPEINCIFLGQKVSFSEANNLGIESSKGRYILIMNPDIIFSEPAVSRLVKTIESNSLSAVCPLLLGKDGKFQNRYFQRFPTITQYLLFYSMFSKIFSDSKALSDKYLCNEGISASSTGLIFTEQIPCAFLLTTREQFEASGRMDKSFRLFFEDVDLCYRLHNFGKIAVDASSRVTHLGGSSFSKQDDYWLYGRFIISMLVFFRKHYGKFRYNVLKYTAVLNSYLILFIERISFRKNKDDYRKRKHEYFLSELKNSG